MTHWIQSEASRAVVDNSAHAELIFQVTHTPSPMLLVTGLYLTALSPHVTKTNSHLLSDSQLHISLHHVSHAFVVCRPLCALYGLVTIWGRSVLLAAQDRSKFPLVRGSQCLVSGFWHYGWALSTDRPECLQCAMGSTWTFRIWIDKSANHPQDKVLVWDYHTFVPRAKWNQAHKAHPYFSFPLNWGTVSGSWRWDESGTHRLLSGYLHITHIDARLEVFKAARLLHGVAYVIARDKDHPAHRRHCRLWLNVLSLDAGKI
jgi:hypothetical protein